jgi:N-methylhydantoinase A
VTVVGVDVGGTFTDVVAAVDGEIITLKIPSTPRDPSESVLHALRHLGLKQFLLLHGTTVATNTVLERKGARTAFVTTDGFRDMLSIGRQTRRRLYDLDPQPTPTLIPASLCFEVNERVTHLGEILRSPTAEEIEALAAKLAKKAVESVAVCFLFSFARPEHELQIREKLHAPFVSLSHEISPEFREYERASTTAINAYVGPRMHRYLSRLDSESKALGAEDLRIMHSNAGTLSIREAANRPVMTLLSGPAAGVVAAWEVARQAGVTRAVSFDMGGTSTDVALLDGGPVATSGGEIDGMPIRVPMMDIHTVGAGGGSIAWIDPAGALRVGPQSAGADPGPAAYGKGTDFTVTDANLILGRLVPETFAAGSIAIDPARSMDAASALAKTLGMKPDDVARAVIGIANANMARAIRRVSISKGYDPAGLSLVPFGGAGALHACALCDLVGLGRILLPPRPGLLSALGLLLAPVQREAVRSVMWTGPVTEAMVREAVNGLISSAAASVGPGVTKTEAMADLRYEGQSWELTVPVRNDPNEAVTAFHAVHEMRYGYSSPGARVEWVALRARVSAPAAGLGGGSLTVPPSSSLPARTDCGDRLPVVDRSRFTGPITGPLLIVQPDTTFFLAPGWSAAPDAHGNLTAQHTR